MAEKISLEQLLENELAVLEELKGLSLQKKEALLNDDLDLLQTIVLREEALSNKLRKIDDACSPQVQFFLKGQKNGAPESAKQLELIRKVHKAAREIQINNDLNQGLLKDNLGIVQFMINSLLPVDDDTPVYGSSGKVRKQKKETMVLDYKG